MSRGLPPAVLLSFWANAQRVAPQPKLIGPLVLATLHLVEEADGLAQHRDIIWGPMGREPGRKPCSPGFFRGFPEAIAIVGGLRDGTAVRTNAWRGRGLTANRLIGLI